MSEVAESSEQLPYLIRTDEDNKRVSKLWCEDRVTAGAMCGHIGLWLKVSQSSLQMMFDVFGLISTSSQSFFN